MKNMVKGLRLSWKRHCWDTFQISQSGELAPHSALVHQHPFVWCNAGKVSSVSGFPVTLLNIYMCIYLRHRYLATQLQFFLSISQQSNHVEARWWAPWGQEEFLKKQQLYLARQRVLGGAKQLRWFHGDVDSICVFWCLGFLSGTWSTDTFRDIQRK